MAKNLFDIAASGVLLKLCRVIFGLTTSVILARNLGPDEYGYYALAITIIGVVTLPTQLGIPTVVVRETSIYLADGNWSGIYALRQWAAKCIFVMSLITSVALYIGLANWYPSFSFIDSLLICFLVPVLAATNLISACLRGLGYVLVGLIPENLVRTIVMVFLCCLAALIFSGGEFSGSVAIALATLAAVASLSVSIIILRYVLLQQDGFNLSSVVSTSAIDDRIKWFLAIIPLSLVAGLQAINQSVDILVVEYYVPLSQLGLYKVALVGSTIVAFGLQAINMVFSPRYAELCAKDDMTELQSVVTLASRGMVFLATPVLLIVLFYDAPLISVFFGIEFQGAGNALKILAIGQFINAFFGPVAMLLIMSGREKLTAIVAGASVMVNIGLSIILVPLIGIEGAAIATAVGIVILNFVLWFFVRRQIRINTTPFGFI